MARGGPTVVAVMQGNRVDMQPAGGTYQGLGRVGAKPLFLEECYGNSHDCVEL